MKVGIDIAEAARRWSAAGQRFIRVTVAKAEGSTPREEGATLLVAADAVSGTIGGGRLEFDAVGHARTMLRDGVERHTDVVHLGPAIGQCCGGRVTLFFDRPTATDVETMSRRSLEEVGSRPSVFVYGAGHVGRALARALAPLPFAVTLIDQRAEELALVDPSGLTLLRSDTPASVASAAPPSAAHVVLTHSHALDSLIAATLLELGSFSYLGIIGSRTKRNSFRKAFRELGLPDKAISRIVCPIGGDRVKDKRPEVIAALTTAEIVAALLGRD